MDDVAIIKFNGTAGFGLMGAAGYTGSHPNVAAAFNQIFAPEIAVSGLSTQLGSASQAGAHDVAAQAFAAVSGLKGISGGRH